MLAYFRELAAQSGLVIPAHGIDCSPGELDAAVCDWDPQTPRLDPSDVHYSNAYSQFEAPNGDPDVIMYLPSLNYFLVVDGALDGTLYQELVAYNECVLGPSLDASTD